MRIKPGLVSVRDIFTSFCVVSVRRHRARPRHSPGSAVRRSDGVHLTGFWSKHTPLQPLPLGPYTVLSSEDVNKSLKFIALRICSGWAPGKRFYCPRAPISTFSGSRRSHLHTRTRTHAHTPVHDHVVLHSTNHSRFSPYKKYHGNTMVHEDDSTMGPLMSHDTVIFEYTTCY